ncbi:MAG: hypothetical protein Q9211_001396 [Gyalolechia sp. 1 TL-2023]
MAASMSLMPTDVYEEQVCDPNDISTIVSTDPGIIIKDDWMTYLPLFMPPNPASATERNGRKTLTTVQGLPKKFDQKKILKVIKKKFACNGTIVNDTEMGEVIQLQGDQRKDVQEFLVDKKEGLALDAKTIKVTLYLVTLQKLYIFAHPSGLGPWLLIPSCNASQRPVRKTDPGDLDRFVRLLLAASVTATGPFHNYLMALADTLGMVANND